MRPIIVIFIVWTIVTISAIMSIRLREETDTFLLAVEASQWSVPLKTEIARVLHKAKANGARTNPTASGTVLLGLSGFYTNTIDEKSFIRIRQKAVVFNGAIARYMDVALVDKLNNTPYVFTNTLNNMARATYVELVPIEQAPSADPAKKERKFCPVFPQPIVGHTSYTKSDLTRCPFVFIDPETVTTDLFRYQVRNDANGFGTVSLMLCVAHTVNAPAKPQGVKMANYRAVQLHMGKTETGKYGNFTRNGEVQDECLETVEVNEDEPHQHILVFVNPSLAPNSKPGTYYNFFSAGYSGLYGPNATVRSLVPPELFDKFLAVSGANERIESQQQEAVDDL